MLDDAETKGSSKRLAALCVLAGGLGWAAGALCVRADHADVASSVRTASVVALLAFAWLLPIAFGFAGVRFASPRPIGGIARYVLAPVAAQFVGFAVGIRFAGINFWGFLALVQPVLALGAGALTKKVLLRRSKPA